MHYINRKSYESLPAREYRGLLPKIKAIYIMYNYTDETTLECVYVGKALDLRNRVKRHLTNSTNEKYNKLFDIIKWYRMPDDASNELMQRVEGEMISRMKPKFQRHLSQKIKRLTDEGMIDISTIPYYIFKELIRNDLTRLPMAARVQCIERKVDEEKTILAPSEPIETTSKYSEAPSIIIARNGSIKYVGYSSTPIKRLKKILKKDETKLNKIEQDIRESSQFLIHQIPSDIRHDGKELTKEDMQDLKFIYGMLYGFYKDIFRNKEKLKDIKSSYKLNMIPDYKYSRNEIILL